MRPRAKKRAGAKWREPVDRSNRFPRHHRHIVGSSDWPRVAPVALCHHESVFSAQAVHATTMSGEQFNSTLHITQVSTPAHPALACITLAGHRFNRCHIMYGIRRACASCELLAFRA